MDQIFARVPTVRVVRGQLTLFEAACAQIGMSLDDQRHALELDERSWPEWRAVLSECPLPCEPPVPEMLRRLADATFHLSIIADRNSVSA